MPDEGKDLGADLYELWLAGRKNLPNVAQVYADANGHVASTEDLVHLAFHRPEQLGGAFGPAYADWRELRDQLQRILADTAANLVLTGQALCVAASMYAATDAEAATEMHRLLDHNGDPTPVDIPPIVYPNGG
jgi:hypothetical protein